jgi:hypothetical protein
MVAMIMPFFAYFISQEMSRIDPRNYEATLLEADEETATAGHIKIFQIDSAILRLFLT